MGLELLGAGAGAGQGLEQLIAQRRADELMRQQALMHAMSAIGLREDRQGRLAQQKNQADALAAARDESHKARQQTINLQQLQALPMGTDVGPSSFARLTNPETGAAPPESFDMSPGTSASLPSVSLAGMSAIGPRGPEGLAPQTQESSRAIDPSFRFKGTAQQQDREAGLNMREQGLKQSGEALKQRGEQQDWRNSIAQQLADMKSSQGPKAPDQNKLENQYRTVLMRAVSSRSGGLGLEDQKVNQANHLISLMKQYDGKNMPANIGNELALGLARLVSPNGNVGIELMRELNQRTAQGGLGSAVAYLTGDPTLVNATPEKVRDVFRDSIMRQGQTAQQSREQYMQYLRSQAPTDLEESRRLHLESGQLNPLMEYAPSMAPAAGGLPPGVTVRKR